MAQTSDLDKALEGMRLQGGYSYAEYLYILAMNESLSSYPKQFVLSQLEKWGIKLFISPDQFWFCLSGLKKSVYYGVYGLDAEKYLGKVYDPWRSLVANLTVDMGYRADTFIVLEEDAKQMAVLFSPGEAPKCTPVELAKKINALGQEIYEERAFQGDARYCNVTALSKELHGYAGIREGYLEARELNDLSFFCMEPKVLTAEWKMQRKNGADYRVVITKCHQLQRALDKGNGDLCRKCLDSLFLQTVKGSLRWTLLQDALSFCKHMLELRCTARGLEGVDLEKLCDPASYLKIEECAEALWPVLNKLCALVRKQGPYQELMLRAVYYIKLHYAEDLTLTDVADYADVNPNYLSGTFQKEMGLSLREYITVQRMEGAKALLAQGDLRVSDVAQRVGVPNVRYFSLLFKKTVGCPPGEYREAQKK